MMKIAATGCLFRLMQLILALVVICVTAEAQKIEVDRYTIDRTDKGFVINGTVTATDLNPPGQVVESDGLSIVAYVKKNSSSQYPKLPESRYVVYPAGAETPFTKGSGPGETMTKAEQEGIDIAKIDVVGLALRTYPVWSSYGGLGEWEKKAPTTVTADFEGIIPLLHEGKEVWIVATLGHTWGGPYASWPAYSFAHGTVYQGVLEAVAANESQITCPSNPPRACPRGIKGAPELKDTSLASDSKCRGACGADCPDTCISKPNTTICVSDPDGKCHYLCTYPGIIECGTNEGCRVHDECYDESVLDARPWVYRRGCDEACIAVYGAGNCSNWMDGLGPFDRNLTFSDPPTMTGWIPGPCTGAA
jgi:hypothetical protein